MRGIRAVGGTSCSRPCAVIPTEEELALGIKGPPSPSPMAQKNHGATLDVRAQPEC